AFSQHGLCFAYVVVVHATAPIASHTASERDWGAHHAGHAGCAHERTGDSSTFTSVTMAGVGVIRIGLISDCEGNVAARERSGALCVIAGVTPMVTPSSGSNTT